MSRVSCAQFAMGNSSRGNLQQSPRGTSVATSSQAWMPDAALARSAALRVAVARSSGRFATA
eukprot:11207022-Lingulodinium_polyedra.AAC.1